MVFFNLNLYRYLCETYDSESWLLPQEAHTRAKVREWIQASEGTFMLNAVPVSVSSYGSLMQRFD